MTRHTRKWKEREVEELAGLIDKSKVVAVADISSFPASLFQELRNKLRGKATIRVSKTSVVELALKKSRLKDSRLLESVNGMVAVIFTEMNPFELYAFLQKNKGSAHAKQGAIAAGDIVVRAGDTGLPPGPALSDLKQAGIDCRVQGGTIAVPRDTVVVKAGQTVSLAAANALTKLDLKPVKLGLNLRAAVEGQEFFEAGILAIDAEGFFKKLVDAHIKAFNLAVNTTYCTPETVKLFVWKAHADALALALSQNILTGETLSQLLAKASLQAQALKSRVKEAGAGNNVKDGNVLEKEVK